MLQSLRGLDSAFLSFETPNSHMHVAQTCVFDPSEVPGGYSFERVRQLVSSRLDRLPPFRRRLVELPFGLGPPVWIEDPDFDLDNHLHRGALPSPGGADELAAYTADVVSRPLDRSQPLWEMHVVEGLEDGLVAAIAKVHHSAIDGVSGAELTANLLDLEPNPPTDETLASTWHPDRPPSTIELALLGVQSVLGQPRAALRAARDAAGAILRIGRNARQPDVTMPPLPFAAPPSTFNAPIGPRRRVAFTRLDVDDIALVRKAADATLNDVLLATCAGALRGYLRGIGECPEKELVAAVPMSVRAPDERGAMGNRLSGMLVGLATTTEDPLARLGAIVECARQAKTQTRLLGESTVSELADVLVPAIARPMARLTRGLGSIVRPRPVFNVMISSFPGPPVPLYCAGARLVAPYPLGPVFGGAALNITVQSYLDQLYIGLVADDRVVPDVDEIASAFPDALGELVKAAA